MAEPKNWLKFVNQAQTEAELAAVRRAVQRSSPLGTPTWQQRISRQLGLESTLRPPGRPRKKIEEGGLF